MAPDKGWTWIGWLGLLLAFEGMADFVLAWLPLRLGRPDWEFGTVAATFAGLPMVSMGFAALLASGLALGNKWVIRSVSVVMLAMATVLTAAYALFLLDVPVALGAVSGDAELGIKKAVIKTSFLGLGFIAGYIVAAVAGLRHLRRGG